MLGQSGEAVGIARVETLDALEELLLEADVGVTATARIIGQLQRGREEASIGLGDQLEREILNILGASSRDASA